MDWFSTLTGFREDGYDSTRERLRVEDGELVSLVNGARYATGELSLPTLGELRSRVEIPVGARSTVTNVVGDARALHSDPELAGALFQVASQFNVLEMVSPGVRPEEGVTIYGGDPTQGPACAIAAGAATIYRNYFAPVGGGVGQTWDRQIDTLARVGEVLSAKLGRPVSELWTMRNGYALCSEEGLEAIAGLSDVDDVRARLAIGVHRDVQVTDVRDERRLVSQAFCSALPVSYGHVRQDKWEVFGRLVLEAAYEATMLAAVDIGARVVMLTRLGGGAFGNADSWINDAMVRALGIVEHAGLDIRLVSRGSVHPSLRAIAAQFDG